MGYQQLVHPYNTYSTQSKYKFAIMACSFAVVILSLACTFSWAKYASTPVHSNVNITSTSCVPHKNLWRCIINGTLDCPTGENVLYDITLDTVAPLDVVTLSNTITFAMNRKCTNIML